MSSPAGSGISRRFTMAGCALLLALAPAVLAADRFLPAAPSIPVDAAWMARSGNLLAFGSGREVFLADAAPSLVVRSRLAVETEVTGGALLRDKLFLVLDGKRLVRLDLGHGGAELQPVTVLSPAAGNRLHLAAMGNLLLVAEDGVGVHVIKFRSMHPMPGHAGHHAAGPALLGRFPLGGRIKALTAAGAKLWIAMETGEELLLVDLRAPSRPVLEQRLYLDTPVRALAGDGTRLHVLTKGGLLVLSAAGEEKDWEVTDRHSGMHGTALISSGRSLLVASEGGGVQSYWEAAPEATFTINVLDDFFTPDTLTVNVGDEVTWLNAAGIHNVISCTVGESGCTENANEMFLSGIPQPGLWSYSYTFTAPGDNPYVCQSHAPFMTGEIAVLPALPTPPPVPDGTFGTPMIVEHHGADALTLYWDVSACTPQDQHEMLYGYGSGFPASPGDTFGLQGGRCELGAVGKYVWTDVPDPSVDSSGLLWWLLVAYGSPGEGSWGEGSDALERNSPFPGGVSGLCGNFVKDLTNTCP